MLSNSQGRYEEQGRSRKVRMLSDSKGDAFGKQKQIMMPMGVG
jgi:hypothetical protein